MATNGNSVAYNLHETSDGEADGEPDGGLQKVRKLESEGRLRLDITLGGLFSFIETTLEGTPVVAILGVAAERRPAGADGCRHRPLLLFDIADLDEFASDACGRKATEHAAEVFWESMIVHDREGLPTALCAWDIAGYTIEFERVFRDAEIAAIFEGTKQSLEFDRGGMLDLQACGGDGVAPARVSDPPQAEGLVTCRLLLYEGALAGSFLTQQPWLIQNAKDVTRGRRRFHQTVDCELRPGEYFRVTGCPSDGTLPRRSLLIKGGGRVFVSNICGARLDEGHVPATDVLAFYDLLVTPPEEDDRFIPYPAQVGVTPRDSACPPVVQDPSED